MMSRRLRTTEEINERTRDLDSRPVLEQVRLMNAEDQQVPGAVADVLPQIAEAVERIAQTLRRNGRLFYVGAGTSGQLGALDAAECPPTFGTAPEQVQAVLAGRRNAVTRAFEDTEDDEVAGAQEMDARMVGAPDTVVGIAASGATPFVLGAVRRARTRGAMTIALCCASPSPIAAACHLAIVPIVGPEVIAGSTRLKAGTAQKLVLNMLSTLAMVNVGKVYGNLMVEMRAGNEKLRGRAVSIVATAAEVTESEAAEALARAAGRMSIAILMLAGRLNADAAEVALTHAGGNLRHALANLHR
jgi:N-acetylmuramic acid 6-phosphate etherase